MRRSGIGIVVVAWCLGLAGAAAGWTAEPPPATAYDLGWLAGCWRSAEAETVIEECWLAPAGGILLGMNRSARGDRAAYEFLRIADEGDGLTYFASPGGRSPATPFRLIELGERRAVFANPEHDFPQRVLYWREGGELRARVEGEIDGETKALDFAWKRSTDG